MSSRASAAALALALALCLGIALGRNSSSRAAPRSPAAFPAPPALRESTDPDQLAPPQPAPRRSSPGSPHAAARSKEVLVPAPGTQTDALLDEFLAAWHAGLFPGNDVLIVPLAEAYLSREGPLRALDLLRRYESERSDLFAGVAVALEGAGLRPQASLVWREVLRLAPGHRSALNKVLHDDPAAAVAILRARLEQTPAPLGLNDALATALLKSGQTSEARALALDTLRDEPHNQKALEVLIGADPAAAEAHARGQLDQLFLDQWQARRLSKSLADSLVAQGRVREAAEVLIDRLDSSKTSAGLRWSLIEIDPARAYQYFSSALPADGADSVIGNLWEETGDSLFEAGDTPTAIEAWVRSIEAGTDEPESNLDMLFAHAPDRVLPALSRRLQTSTGGGTWAYLGDAYWRAGKRVKAVAAWERARAIEPGPTWWADQLASVAAGLDPLD